MNSIYTSRFGGFIDDYLKHKQSLGFKHEEQARILRHFDELCRTRFPRENTLTKDICFAWAAKRESESFGTFGGRISVLRQFARYLNQIGEMAFVIPSNWGHTVPRYIPYIYSESEIVKVWEYMDNLVPVPQSRTRHIVLPAVVRILYCCGLRPGEARRLKVDDVNLHTGKVYIRESKGHKDRIVMLADDAINYYQNYNENIMRLQPGREWFFPTSKGQEHQKYHLDSAFRACKAEVFADCASHNPLRLYDFRHTFATHRLYRWLREGKDLNAMFPYLSAYMGHAKLSCTYYYIHLVPEQLKAMSGLDFSKYESLLPEVECDE
jgi:integrase/recombinase XerD